MKNKFYVTTPIYYPNDVPHIGHAYTTLAADVLARWYKLKGFDVRFLTGTDEHGKKIENAAKKKNKSPKKFVDDLVPEFKDAWKKLNIDYDRFIRTTDKDHVKKVQEILQKVYDSGDIYLGKYEGFYCTGCEAYYTEKGLEDGCCPIHKTKIEKLKEESYFFRLSKYQDKLLKLYEKTPELIQPAYRRKEIINRIKEGLRDLSISRTSFSWGIPLPFDKKHVAYVWFDALLNYVSGANGFWPADLHLVGKDILWFHTVIWHSILLSAGLDLPKTVFAHGWWTFDKEKISKSRGKILNVDDLIKIAGVDSARYFLFRSTPFGEDGDFSEKALIDRHNNELADKLGNLVSRVSALAERYGLEKFDWKKSKNEVLIRRNIAFTNMNLFTIKVGNLHGLWKALEKSVEKHFNNYEFDKVLNDIFAFVDICNEYVQEKKPWETEDKKVLYELKEGILKIAFLLKPFIPETAEKIEKIFNAKKIKKGEILFKKI